VKCLSKYRGFVLLLLALVMGTMFGGISCDWEESGSEVAAEIFLEYAEYKAWRLALAEVIGATGDEEVDAAVDAHRVIKDIQTADDAMQEGRQAQKDGDLIKAADFMRSAVSTRPGDWTYRVLLSVCHLEKSATEASPVVVLKHANDRDDEARLAAEAQDKANGWPEGYGPAFRRYTDQNIRELEAARSRMESLGFKHVAPKCELYRRLFWNYRKRAEGESAEAKTKEFEYQRLLESNECSIIRP